MKSIKIAIIILIIIIISLVIGIVIQKNKNNIDNTIISTEKNNYIEGNIIEDEDITEYIDKEKYDKKLEYVLSRNNYFTIKSIYNKYLSLAADDNNELINVFSKEYSTKYQITKENVVSYTGIKPISDPRNYGVYVPMISDIICADISDNMQVYIVYGKYLLKSTGSINDLNLMIILDTNNMIYDVYNYTYMKEKGYNNLSKGSTINIKEYEIQNRKTNKVSPLNVNDLEMANNYFNDWKNRYLYDTKSAYNKLDNNYANSRFGNYSNFTNYIKNLNYVPIINEYRTYSTSNYTDYICTDQYNNYYIFRQQGGIMRYTVFLDSYTVELDTFKDNYENADEDTKLAINVGKFKQMLNRKDYNAIYNKLDNTFKNNNFSSVAKLENYLKTNTYDINTIEIDDYSKQNDYYACKCKLINQKNSNEQKEISLIIKLIDSNNFVMSFNFNQ